MNLIKAEMQRLWYDWMSEGEHTKTGKRREISVIINLIHINVYLFLFYLKNTLRIFFENIPIV